MGQRQENDWQWYRCSILGCGAVPLRVRRHPSLRGSWSVGFTDSSLWVIPGPAPACPRCGDELEMLAPGSRRDGAEICHHA